MTDRYTRAITYLSENPRSLEEAWADPYRVKGGSLFIHATKGRCGCLVQMKGKDGPYPTHEIGESLRADPRIHPDIGDLCEAWQGCQTAEERRELLAPYAEWQRKLDESLDRAEDPRYRTAD